MSAAKCVLLVLAMTVSSDAVSLRGSSSTDTDELQHYKYCVSDADCSKEGWQCYKFFGSLSMCHKKCPPGWACARDPVDEAPVDSPIDDVAPADNDDNDDDSKPNPKGKAVGNPHIPHPRPTTAPATSAPVTAVPVTTDAPAAPVTATMAPATAAPSTSAPTTTAPATDAPSTQAPATAAPVTATEAPATAVPTVAPTLGSPSSSTPASGACARGMFEGCGSCWNNRASAASCAGKKNGGRK